MNTINNAPQGVNEAIRANVEYWTQTVETLEAKLNEYYAKRHRVRFNQTKFRYRDAVAALAAAKVAADALGVVIA